MYSKLIQALSIIVIVYRKLIINNYFLRALLSKPQIFSVEINVSCNLRCPECALGGDYITRTRGSLSLDQFKLIADKIRNYAKVMNIMIWGEPLLHDDLIEMISYASKFCRTVISTNGMLVNQEIAEKLITSGLHDLIVSIDGTSQEAYQKYRVGGNLSKALNALLMLNQSNVNHGRKVNIIPQFIVFKHNQHEMNQFRKICSDIGLKPSFKAPYIRSNSIFSNSDDTSFTRKAYSTILDLRTAMRSCNDPWKVFTILFDGTVVACCYDYNGETRFGNIFTQDVSEIWGSPNYVAFRKQILSGDAPDICVRNCLEYCLIPRSK